MAKNEKIMMGVALLALALVVIKRKKAGACGCEGGVATAQAGEPAPEPWWSFAGDWA